MDLIESDGQNSAPKQTADVEAAVVQGVDAIVISPLDVNALAARRGGGDPGRRAGGHHRPPVDGVEGILAHVGADNVKGGEAQAQRSSRPSRTARKSSTCRASPARAGHRPQPGRPQRPRPRRRQVPDHLRADGQLRPAEALTVTEAGLAANGEPDVIVCANDDMALGAIEACAARGFTNVKIYGFDALPEALVAVRDGTWPAPWSSSRASSPAPPSASRWPSPRTAPRPRATSCFSPPS